MRERVCRAHDTNKRLQQREMPSGKTFANSQSKSAPARIGIGTLSIGDNVLRECHRGLAHITLEWSTSFPSLREVRTR
jgi:hypothetical protein